MSANFESSASNNNDLETSNIYVIKGVGCLAEAESGKQLIQDVHRHGPHPYKARLIEAIC